MKNWYKLTRGGTYKSGSYKEPLESRFCPHKERVVDCKTFSELLPILQSDLQSFKLNSLNATFSRWGRLWRNCYHEDPPSGEFLLMQDHLAGKLYQDLIKRALQLKSNLNTQDLSAIAHAISQLPLTKESTILLREIMESVSRSTLKDYHFLDLALLIQAVSRTFPDDRATISFVERLAKRVATIDFEPNTLSTDAALLTMGKTADFLSTTINQHNIASVVINKIANFFDDHRSFRDRVPMGFLWMLCAVAKVSPQSKIARKLARDLAETVCHGPDLFRSDNYKSKHHYQSKHYSKMAYIIAETIPAEEIARTFVAQLTKYINKNHESFKSFKPLSFARVAHALAKVDPESESSQTVLRKIAVYVYRLDDLKKFTIENLNMLVNALKMGLPRDDIRQKLMKKIAEHVDSLESVKVREKQDYMDLKNLLQETNSSDSAQRERETKAAHDSLSSSPYSFPPIFDPVPCPQPMPPPIDPAAIASSVPFFQPQMWASYCPYVDPFKGDRILPIPVISSPLDPLTSQPLVMTNTRYLMLPPDVASTVTTLQRAEDLAEEVALQQLQQQVQGLRQQYVQLQQEQDLEEEIQLQNLKHTLQGLKNQYDQLQQEQDLEEEIQLRNLKEQAQGLERQLETLQGQPGKSQESHSQQSQTSSDLARTSLRITFTADRDRHRNRDVGESRGEKRRREREDDKRPQKSTHAGHEADDREPKDKNGKGERRKRGRT